MSKRNLGFTFGRTPEDNERDYQALIKRLAEQGQNPKLKPINPELKPKNDGGFIDDKWVYVPSISTYFAKERSNQGLDWNATHKILIPQGLYMPTIAETWELIFYLKENLADPEHRRVYDDILKKTREGWHGEWQNDRFSVKKGKSYVERVTGLDSKGELVFSPKRELSDYLSSDGWADISSRGNMTPDGLCKIASQGTSYTQGENIYFWTPVDGQVARFIAYSGGVVIGCNRVPNYADDSLGVRAARKFFFD